MKKLTLIDSNIIIDAIRGSDKAAEYLDSLPDIRISIVTASEILEGSLTKKEMKKNFEKISEFEVIPLSETISEMAFNLVEKYFLKEGLNYTDALIVSTAIIGNMQFSTLDKRHFKNIAEISLSVPY